MVGEWRGDGDIMVPVEKCKQRKMQFGLTLGAQGRVSGYVGDAKITDGEFQKTAWFLRWMGKDDYRALIQMSGSMIENQNFTRKTAIITFRDITDDKFTGTYTSDPGRFGNESYVFKVANIQFKKVY
jgi:hypothetical protein